MNEISNQEQKIFLKVRGKIIEINTNNLLENFKIIKSRLSQNSKIFPVVKSSAYGHGIENIVPFIDKFADGWCVGRIEEAYTIRKFSKKAIVILKGVEQNQVADEISGIENIFVVVRDLEDLEIKMKSEIQNIIIKIDTGMGRLGILPNQFQKIQGILEKHDRTKEKIKGAMTHFAYSDFGDMDFIEKQKNIFDDFTEKLEKFLRRKILKTIANSAGTISDRSFHKDIVRPGICIYGISPFGKNNNFGLKPVMSVKTKVLATKSISKGWSVGYSRRFISADEIKVAILDVGYSDGIPRRLWEDGFVFIKGKKFKIIGVISMDMMCVLCDDTVKPGDEAYILGDIDGITAYDLAERVGTIPYEILCLLGVR